MLSEETVPNNGTKRPLVIASVMASMSMIAIEATIVATAMPQIATQLGKVELYSWVFTSFLLAQTVMTVVFGRLADIYGRKPILLAGVVVFVAASLAAGFTDTMVLMIVCRLFQGIAAGAVQPVSITVVGDLYPTKERGKIQGYLASVWAVSAVAGPILGSLIVQFWSWGWIFWINVPIGVLALLGFALFFHENSRPPTGKVDLWGGLLFVLIIVMLIAALSEGMPSSNSARICAVLAFLACSCLFLWWESTVSHPMISLPLWSRRSIAAVNCALLLGSMAVMGLTTFLPMYVQAVLGRSPVEAGLTLTMLLVSWPLAATFAVRIIARVGAKSLIVAGSLFVPVGASVFLVLTPASSSITATAGSLIMGVGMGFMSVSALLLIQDIVEWNERGSATASNIFARNFGSALGAAAFGAVFNGALRSSAFATKPLNGEQLRRLIEGTNSLSASDPARLALQQALHSTFVAMMCVSLLTIAASMMLSRRAPESGPLTIEHTEIH